MASIVKTYGATQYTHFKVVWCSDFVAKILFFQVLQSVCVHDGEIPLCVMYIHIYLVNCYLDTEIK